MKVKITKRGFSDDFNFMNNELNKALISPMIPFGFLEQFNLVLSVLREEDTERDIELLFPERFLPANMYGYFFGILRNLENKIDLVTSDTSILSYLKADEHEIEVEFFSQEEQKYKTYVPENFFAHDFHIVKNEIAF